MYFENEILHPGEKIKKIRLLINAKQKELTDKHVSRNFISLVENLKSPLSLKAAQIIADNINRIILENEYNLPAVTAEELTKDTNTQATELFRKTLEGFINTNNTCSMKEQIEYMDSLTIKYNIPDNLVYDFYEKCIDFFYSNYEFEKIEIYIMKQYRLAITNNDDQQIINVLLIKMRTYIRLGKNDDAIEIGLYILKYMENNNIKHKKFLKNVYFNISLAYKKNNNLTEGLKYINKLKKFNLKENELVDVLTLKGLLYKESGALDKAKDLLKQALYISNNNDDIQNVAMNLNNLAMVTYLEENYYEAFLYVDRALSLDKKKIDEQMLSEIYYYAFIIYKEKNVKGFEKFFHIGLENTKNNRNFEIKNKFFIDMYSYLKANKEIKKLNYFLDLLRIHYDDNEIPKEILNISIDAGKLLYKLVY